MFEEISLTKVAELMFNAGATNLYIKELAENDNSKNQIYLGGDYSTLNILPMETVTTDSSPRSSKRDRFKARLSFHWLQPSGIAVPAPGAQLILYPKYPEVRLSGFLKGSDAAPSELMRLRAKGRVMLLGITANGKVLATVFGASSLAAREAHSRRDFPANGVFLDASLLLKGIRDTKRELLLSLKAIHEKGWIDAKRLSAGTVIPYDSPNSGGYTLEAELGVSPNGMSDPDFLGWEIKQYGVRDLSRCKAKSPLTLMTPEPTGGEYRTLGVEGFIRKYGYPDRRSRPDRLNFGGIYLAGQIVTATGLRLELRGFDSDVGNISDAGGGICLINAAGKEAAIWHFADLLKHWNRKHNKAAYVPSISKALPSRAFMYGSRIHLGEGTDFALFLLGMSRANVYYDPGIKLEGASTGHPRTKRRSQFRIGFEDLPYLYKSFNQYDLSSL